MVRKIILALAVFGAFVLSSLDVPAFGTQFAARPTQETIQKKVSSRKTATEPTRTAATIDEPEQRPRSIRKSTIAPTPLKPMIVPDATEQKDLEVKTPTTASEQPQSVTTQMSLQTKVIAPHETIVKQPARVSISVTNDGPTLTDPAILIVWLPKTVQLLSSQPQLTRQDNGSYEILIPEIVGKATQEFNLDVTPTTLEPIQVRTQIQMLASQEIGIRVGRPELNVDFTAPEFSFQNAENLYSIDVRNDSPVELSQVRVVAKVPEGLNVITLNRAAKIDDQNRTLTWDIGQLGGQEKELIQFKAVALQSGAQTCLITAESTESEPCEVSISTTIDARPDLKIGLNSHGGAVQLNQTATLEMTIENRGTEAASNVELEVAIPDALKTVESGEYQVQGNRLVFPATVVEAGEQRSIFLQFTGSEPGEHVVRAQLKSASQRTIATEDTLFVYDAAAPRSGSSNFRAQHNLK